MLKEAVIGHFKIGLLSQYLLGANEENYEQSQSV
jgi:hypothetical protein